MAGGWGAERALSLGEAIGRCGSSSPKWGAHKARPQVKCPFLYGRSETLKAESSEERWEVKVKRPPPLSNLSLLAGASFEEDARISCQRVQLQLWE